MDSEFSLFPEQASTIAPRIDALYFFLIWVSAFFTILIAALIVYFAIKYRRGSKADRAQGDQSTLAMELVWIFVPLAITMVIFAWGARLFFIASRAPAGAMEIDVVAKQWMWKFKHRQGNREINNLHVPVGTAIKLNMTSEDVIHSLFIPAFRVKQDVLPGRQTSLWFEATQTGEFHLFCTEYCGTKHSQMIGRVTVMEPADYQNWLTGDVRGEAPEVAGRRIFEEQQCVKCHEQGQTALSGPPLAGIMGKTIQLEGGATVVADRDYIRRSIVRPREDVVAGFEPIMPSFEGLLTEEDLIDLTAYISSLTQPEAATPEPQTTP